MQQLWFILSKNFAGSTLLLAAGILAACGDSSGKKASPEPVSQDSLQLVEAVQGEILEAQEDKPWSLNLAARDQKGNTDGVVYSLVESSCPRQQWRTQPSIHANGTLSFEARKGTPKNQPCSFTIKATKAGLSLTTPLRIAIAESADTMQWVKTPPESIELKWGEALDLTLQSSDDDENEAPAYSFTTSTCKEGWAEPIQLDSRTGQLTGRPGSLASRCEISIEVSNKDSKLKHTLTLEIRAAVCKTAEVWLESAVSCVSTALTFATAADRITLLQGEALDATYSASNQESRITAAVTQTLTGNTCQTGWDPALAFDVESGRLSGKPGQAAVGSCELVFQASNGYQTLSKTVQVVVNDRDDPAVWLGNQASFTHDEDENFDLDLRAFDPDVIPASITYSLGASTCPQDLWRVSPSYSANGRLKGQAKRGSRVNESCQLVLLASQTGSPTSEPTVLGRNETSQTIKDNDQIGIQSVVRIQSLGVFSGTTQVQVALDHTYSGDLRIKLKKGGKEVLLWDREGSAADWTTQTFAGEKLSAFFGQVLEGDWILEIADTAGGDVGTLRSWSIGSRDRFISRSIQLSFREKTDVPVWTADMPQALEVRPDADLAITPRAVDDDQEPITYSVIESQRPCRWQTTPRLDALTGRINGFIANENQTCELKVQATSGQDSISRAITLTSRKINCQAGTVWLDDSRLCAATTINFTRGRTEISLVEGDDLSEIYAARNLDSRVTPEVRLRMARSTCVTGWSPELTFNASSGQVQGRPGQGAVGRCEVEIEADNTYQKLSRTLKITITERDDPLRWVDEQNTFTRDEDENFRLDLQAFDPDVNSGLITYSLGTSTCARDIWRVVPSISSSGQVIGQAKRGTRENELCQFDVLASQASPQGGGTIVLGKNESPQTIKDADPAGIQSVIKLGAVGVFSSSTQVQVALDHTFSGDLRIKLKKGAKEALLWNNEGSGADWTTQTFVGDKLSAFFGENLEGDWVLEIADTVMSDVGTLRSWSISARGNSISRRISLNIGEKPDLPVWSSALPQSLNISWGASLNVTATAQDDDGEAIAYSLAASDNTCQEGWIIPVGINPVSGLITGSPGKLAQDCRISIKATSGTDSIAATLAVKVLPVVCESGIWQDGAGCLPTGMTLTALPTSAQILAGTSLRQYFLAKNIDERLLATFTYKIVSDSCQPFWEKAPVLDLEGRLTAETKSDAVGSCRISVEASNGYVQKTADFDLNISKSRSLAWVDTTVDLTLDEDQSFSQAFLAQGVDDISYNFASSSCDSALWRQAPSYRAGVLQAEAKAGTPADQPCFLSLEASSTQGNEDLLVAMDTVRLSVPTQGVALERVLSVPSRVDERFSSQSKIKIVLGKTNLVPETLRILKGLKQIDLRDARVINLGNETILEYSGSSLEELYQEALAGDWTLQIQGASPLQLQSWSLTTRGSAIQKSLRVTINEKPDPLEWSSGNTKEVSLKSGDALELTVKAQDDDRGTDIRYKILSQDSACDPSLWKQPPTLAAATGVLRGRAGVISTATSCAFEIEASNNQNERIVENLQIKLMPVVCSSFEIFDEERLQCVDTRLALLPLPPIMELEKGQNFSVQVVAQNNDLQLLSPISYALSQGDCQIEWEEAPAFASPSTGLLRAKPKADQAEDRACELRITASNSHRQSVTQNLKLILSQSLQWDDAGPDVVKLYRGQNLATRILAADRKSRNVQYKILKKTESCESGWASVPTISTDGSITGRSAEAAPDSCSIHLRAEAGTSALERSLRVAFENCPTGTSWNQTADSCQTLGERTIRLASVNGQGLRFQVGFASNAPGTTSIFTNSLVGGSFECLVGGGFGCSSNFRCARGICEGMVSNTPGIGRVAFNFQVQHALTTIDKGQVIVDFQNTSDTIVQRERRLIVERPGRVKISFKSEGTDAHVQLPSGMDASLQSIKIGGIRGGRFAADPAFLCIQNVCEGYLDVSSVQPIMGKRNLAYFQYQAEAVERNTGRILRSRGYNAVYIDLDKDVSPTPGAGESSELVLLGGVPELMKQDIGFRFTPTAEGLTTGDVFVLEEAPHWLSIDAAEGTVTGLPASGSARPQFTIAVTRGSTIVARKSFSASFVEDPLKQYAWHLANSGQSAFAFYPGVAGFDVNLTETLRSGITGRGIRIAVSDEGLEMNHPDLFDNIDKASSRDYGCPLDATFCDPHDATNPSGSGDHGTSVAGLIGAVGWNNKGSRGVAPGATLFGLNFLLNQEIENEIDQIRTDARIVNQSWGYSPLMSNGNIQLDPEVELAIEDVLRNKGTIFVKSAGNDHSVFGSANMDPMNSHRGFIIVGALNASGLKSSYSSTGSNLWVSAPGGEYGYSSDSSMSAFNPTLYPAMVTTDQAGCSRGYSNYVSNPFDAGEVEGNTNCDFVSSFNGTSSAAPVTSGAIALLLEAKPRLTWRDVKHILASTSTRVDEYSSDLYHDVGGTAFVYEQGWETNAAGFSFHNWYGFGLVNVDAAVGMARRNYQLLKPEILVPWTLVARNLHIPDFDVEGLRSTFVSTKTMKVESVQIKLNVAHDFPAELSVELISPAGTRSVLLNMKNGYSGRNFNELVLLSNAFYGESTAGTWTLRIRDGSRGISGKLSNWSIQFQGHEG